MPLSECVGRTADKLTTATQRHRERQNHFELTKHGAAESIRSHRAPSYPQRLKDCGCIGRKKRSALRRMGTSGTGIGSCSDCVGFRCANPTYRLRSDFAFLCASVSLWFNPTSNTAPAASISANSNAHHTFRFDRFQASLRVHAGLARR